MNVNLRAAAQSKYDFPTVAESGRPGKSHVIEPEADALNYIDFEDTPYEVGFDNHLWDRRMMDAIMMDHLAIQKAYNREPKTRRAIRDALADGDLVEAWNRFESLVNRAGFDTYNSDTRFEVFPAGTPESL